MTKTKLKTPEARSHSKFEKRINRLLKRIYMLERIIDARKEQVRLFNLLIQKLLNDGRLTKEELSEFSPPKKHDK